MSEQTPAGMLLNIATEKFKYGFYGYIATSFLFFNLENIILVFKSKNEIEMTLIYIYAQKDFWGNFIVKPFKYGLVASIVMPFVIAFWGVFTGIAANLYDERNKVAASLVAFIPLTVTVKNLMRRIERKRGEIIDLNAEFKQLNTYNNSLLIQKENLQTFLYAVAKIYRDIPRINTEQDLLEVFKRAKEDGLLETYSKQALELSLLKEFAPKPVSEESQDESPAEAMDFENK